MTQVFLFSLLWPLWLWNWVNDNFCLSFSIHFQSFRSPFLRRLLFISHPDLSKYLFIFLLIMKLNRWEISRNLFWMLNFKMKWRNYGNDVINGYFSRDSVSKHYKIPKYYTKVVQVKISCNNGATSHRHKNL